MEIDGLFVHTASLAAGEVVARSILDRECAHRVYPDSPEEGYVEELDGLTTHFEGPIGEYDGEYELIFNVSRLFVTDDRLDFELISSSKGIIYTISDGYIPNSDRVDMEYVMSAMLDKILEKWSH